MWRSVLDSKPDIGRPVVAIYWDGSGAVIGRVTSHEVNGFNIAEAEDGSESYVDIETGFSSWAYLPEDTQFWFERPGQAEQKEPHNADLLP